LGRISDAQIEAVRQRADIVAVIGERVALEKKGRDYMARCPFHDEKTPSFSVNPQKQAWYCHGSCKKGGNVITFVQEFEKLKFPEAVRQLASRFGVHIEDETPEERARSRRKADLLDALNKTVAFYRRQLVEGKSESAKKARAFLERRGVREEAAAAFSLGVAPPGNALLRAIQKKPAAESRAMLPLLAELGLVRNNRSDFFSNRLLFPIADESGRWIGFGGRRLDEEEQPKFKNSTESPGIFEKKKVLYGLDKARAAQPRVKNLVVVEGYIDVVIAHQAGCENVVGALSTGFTKEHTALARRFVESVVVLFDGDAAGQTSNRRVLEDLLDTGLDVRVAALPDKTDPDDYILREGKEGFERLVATGSQDVFQYLVDVIAKKTTGSGTASRAATVAECARLLGKFKDDIRHQLSLKHVAERLSFPEDVLRREAMKAREHERKAVRPGPGAADEAARDQHVFENTHPHVREVLGPHACAGEPFEIGLLEGLLAGERPGEGQEIGADDFTAGPLRELARVVLAVPDGADTEALVLDRLQATPGMRPVLGVATRLLARIAEQAKVGDDKKTGRDWRAEVEGGARALVARRNRARAEQLVAEIEQANRRGDDALVGRLLAENNRLARDARG
jgi:DNA primase